MSLSDDVKIEDEYDSDTSEVTSKPFRPLSPDLSPVKRRRLCAPVTFTAASTSALQVKDEIPTPAADGEEDELDFPSSPSGDSELDYDDDDENDETHVPDITDPADYVPSTVGLAPRAHPRDRLDDGYIMRYTTVYPHKALRIARIREESELFRKSRARISKVRCLAPPRPKRPDGSVGWHQAKKWAKMRKWSGQNKTWIEADLCRMWNAGGVVAGCLACIGGGPCAGRTESTLCIEEAKLDYGGADGIQGGMEVWRVYTTEKHFLAGPRDIPRYRLQGTLQPEDISLEDGGGTGIAQMSYFHLAQIVDRRRSCGQAPAENALDAIRAARRPIPNIGFMLEREWEEYVRVNPGARKQLYQWIRLRLFVEAYEWIQRTVPATLSNLMEGCEVRWTPADMPASIDFNLVERALALVAYCGGAHKMLKRQQDEEEWMSRGSQAGPIDLSDPAPTQTTAAIAFGDAEADTVQTLLRAMARLDGRCSFTKR